MADDYREEGERTYVQKPSCPPCPKGDESGGAWKTAAVLLAVLMVVFAALYFFYPLDQLKGTLGGGTTANDTKYTYANQSAVVNTTFWISKLHDSGNPPHYYVAQRDANYLAFIAYKNCTPTLNQDRFEFKALKVGSTQVKLQLDLDNATADGTLHYVYVVNISITSGA